MLGPQPDGVLELVDAGEAVPAEAAVGELPEPAFEEVQPRRAVGVKCRWNLFRFGWSSQARTTGCLWLA